MILFLKRLILKVVPDSWHQVYHRNICLRFGLGFRGQFLVAAGILLFLGLCWLLWLTRST